MCELIDNGAGRSDIHRQLLASTAIIALAVNAAFGAAAEEVEKPTIWIELGGQLERVDVGRESYMPPFLSVAHDPNPINDSLIKANQRPARYSVGGEGKLTFSPNDVGWTFSIGARYGRSNAARESHQQTEVYFTQPKTVPPARARLSVPATRYATSNSKSDENHFILDFSAGRDVGIGAVGREGLSSFGFGARFAQFESRGQTNIYARPDAMYRFRAPKYFPEPLYHRYQAHNDASRSFRGAGPSVSWNASANLGAADDMAFMLDWGVNASVLFGRQKVAEAHSTYGLYYTVHRLPPPLVVRRVTYSYSTEKRRSRSVVIPNIGGTAGVSFKFPNAKISLGYRADFFFGAMDTGIDARQTKDVGFHGPFATISIGL